MHKNFWLGFAAYLVPTFPLGYFWHLTIFAEQYHQLDMYRTEVIIPMGLGSMLIQAVFFSWSFPRLFDTGRAKWTGNALAAFIAFTALAWSFVVLPVAAKYRMTSVPDFIILESCFTVLQFAIVTPLLALAHRSSR